MINYVALGDSISIDDYPSLDATGGLHDDQPYGAASQFTQILREAQNFELNFTNKTADGATIFQIRGQLRELAAQNIKPDIITLTAGGNDISFGAMKLETSRRLRTTEFDILMNNITREYRILVMEIYTKYPHANIIVNTLYDPTDKTGFLPENCGRWSDIALHYSIGRRQLGRFIANWAAKFDFLHVADIYELFHNHGVNEPDVASRYYYEPFMIEPNARGAVMIANEWYRVFKSGIYNHPNFFPKLLVHGEK